VYIGNIYICIFFTMIKYRQLYTGAILFALMFLSCAPKKEQQLTATKGYPINRLTDSIRSQFTSLVNSSYRAADSGMVALAVYLQQGDSVLVDTAYFFSNNNQPLPNDSTVFQMGSVTKTFTAALIARQVNLGKLNLNGLAQSYLPANGAIPVPLIPDSFNRQPAGITLANLASMNAGLARNVPFNHATNSTPYPYAFAYLNKNPPLLYKPGSTCNLYSNLGFAILGLVTCLQAYPGTANYYNQYEKVVVDSLLTPLAMHDTRISLSKNQMNRRAVPYGEKGARTGYSNPNWPMNLAAGGLYSTLRDMRLYANEMVGLGSYLTPQDIDTLLQQRGNIYKDTCQVKNGHPGAGQAMAWVINAGMTGSSNTTFNRYSKDGGLEGFSTYITFSTPSINGVPCKAWVVLWANKQGFPVQLNAPKVMQQAYDLLQ
jgi:CubicO group peptidase (beta-lactamase class C family)